MRASILLPNIPTCKIYVGLSSTRIRNALERWGLGISARALSGVLVEMKGWMDILSLPEHGAAIARLLAPVFLLAGRPQVIVSVYPVPGPPDRVGGQAFPEDNSVEIWCSGLDIKQPESLHGIVAHECAHLVFNPMLQRTTYRRLSRSTERTGPGDTVISTLSEVVVRACVRFPLEPLEPSPRDIRDFVIERTAEHLHPEIQRYLLEGLTLDEHFFRMALKALRAVEAIAVLRRTQDGDSHLVCRS